MHSEHSVQSFAQPQINSINATFKNFHLKMWHQLFISILFLFYFTNGQVGQSFGPRPVYVDNSNSQQGKIIKIRI